MRIVVVCTGNTCRSPMGAALLRLALDKRGRQDIMIESAGISAFGEPASAGAIAAIAELDAALAADMTKHMSQTVTPELLGSADVIAVMTSNHAKAVKAMGADEEKIHVLSTARADGIGDPYGGDLNTYRAVRDQIAEAVERLLQKLGI